MMKKQKTDLVETDLLIGITSISPNDPTKHFFLCDLDTNNIKKIMKKIGEYLIEKRKYGTIYMVKSGRGYHIVSFSKLLTLEEYVNDLKAIGADPKYVEWVEKVKYGVLRLSRRSSHRQVPKLEKILLSPYNDFEDEITKNLYFYVLNLEQDYHDIVRVGVRK